MTLLGQHALPFLFIEPGPVASIETAGAAKADQELPPLEASDIPLRRLPPVEDGEESSASDEESA